MSGALCSICSDCKDNWARKGSLCYGCWGKKMQGNCKKEGEDLDIK